MEFQKFEFTQETLSGRCVRGFLDVTSFVLCIVLIIVQLGLIDYYYLSILSDHVWWSWLGADVIVIAVMLWLLVLAVRYNQQSMEEMCSVGGSHKLRHFG